MPALIPDRVQKHEQKGMAWFSMMTNRLNPRQQEKEKLGSRIWGMENAPRLVADTALQRCTNLFTRCRAKAAQPGWHIEHQLRSGPFHFRKNGGFCTGTFLAKAGSRSTGSMCVLSRDKTKLTIQP
jgi:hypothetical protein